ncbi:hypothetical protein XacyCFBP2565_07045 [Xanthomonas arboricola pv. corylina]|nr:hypothetical protein XacyCFBP2565_07045 [Xanthomonas arboricola pv. corylina]
MGQLHQHLLDMLDMLGAKDHVDAGRIIGELHAAALNEHSGNSGQLQPPSAAARLNEPFGDSEWLAPGAGSGGDRGYNLSTSDGARSFIADYFAKELVRHDFAAYIKTRLAADFACALAGHLAARQPVGVEPVAWHIEHPDGLVALRKRDSVDEHMVEQAAADRVVIRPLVFGDTAPAAQADRLAIKMLVAAGFVSEDKANESLRLAHGFGGDLGQSAPAAAGVPGECVYAMNTGEQDEQGHELYVLTDKPIPLSDYELLYRSAPAQPSPAAVPVDVLRDAERFRWLMENCLDKWEDRHSGEPVDCSFNFNPKGHDMGCAIDAAIRATHPQPAAAILSTGVQAIAEERARQVQVEGMTPEGDAGYRYGQLAWAAVAYLQLSAMELRDGGRAHIATASPPACWPWDASWWKPRDVRRDLVRAGALIAAQLDAIDQQAKPEVGNG